MDICIKSDDTISRENQAVLLMMRVSVDIIFQPVMDGALFV